MVIANGNDHHYEPTTILISYSKTFQEKPPDMWQYCK